MTATRTERGVALLVGGGLAVILVVWGAIHVAGWTLGTASHTEHRVIHGPLSALRIDNDGRGDVVVESGSGPDVTVDSEARGSFRAPRLRVDVNGSDVRVHGGCGPALFDRCQASVTVRVPSGTPVEVSSRGDVSAFGLSGPVRMTTASGDVTAADVSGAAQLSTSSGDIQVHDLSADATLETGSGDVEGSDLSAGTVRARSGSGDVDLVFATAPDRADAQTGSGDVDLVVPHGARYAVDAETASGDRTIVGVPRRRHSGHVLHVRAGSGDIAIVTGS
jgi:Putative adhesin